MNESQRKCLDCIKTGFVVHEGERFRSLNLTTAEDMKYDLMKAFTVLRSRICNLTVAKLVKSGHIYESEVSKYYPDVDLTEKFGFTFIAVRTSEGVVGVLHIIYIGQFLPRRWLKETWFDITKTALIIGVGDVRSKEGIAEYISNQSEIIDYISSQSKFEHFSYSRDWCFPNYSTIYRKFRSNFWKEELSYLAVGMDGCYGLNSYHLYKRVYDYLSYEEKQEFYNKRWREWLHYIRSRA